MNCQERGSRGISPHHSHRNLSTSENIFKPPLTFFYLSIFPWVSTLGTFFLKQEYEDIAAPGDPLSDIDGQIDWKMFRHRSSTIYQSDTDGGGRPHTDVIVLMNLLVLQQWYGLSDYELDRQAGDRISFRHFLGYPATIPDRSTIWAFKNRLVDAGMIDDLWTDLQQQLDARGLKIHRGVIQDATFITADPGHATADTPRGDQARTRRSRDGTWAKKGKKSQFG